MSRDDEGQTSACQLTPRELAGRVLLCRAAVEYFGFERLLLGARNDRRGEKEAFRNQQLYLRMAAGLRAKLRQTDDARGRLTVVMEEWR